MSAELLHAAKALHHGGCSIVPIDRTTKRPHYKLLPLLFDTAGQPVMKTGKDGSAYHARGWEPFQHTQPTLDDITRWHRLGAQFALVSGAVSAGVECIDFDLVHNVLLYEAWRRDVDDLADGLLVQRTGGGGLQVVYRYVADIYDGNTKLAWLPDDTQDDGRSIAIETRGEGGFFVIAPSLHPSGTHYELLSGNWSHIPVISRARRDALLAAARRLDRMPKTRRQMEQAERRAKDSETAYRASLNGQAGVIDAFNEHTTIEAELERHGYKPEGERYIRPGADECSQAGVVIKDGRSFHHSSNDPLNDGYWKKAFDVRCHYEYNGDVKDAVKALASELGMAYEVPKTDDTTTDTPPELTQSQRVLQTLRGLGYTFALNRCDDSVEVNGEPITDPLGAKIRTQMRDRGFKSGKAVEDAYIAAALDNGYHPIRDYLTGLAWDGRDHIGILTQHLQSDDAPVVYQDGTQKPLHAVYLRRWLIGAVAKVLANEQNLMLVLAGPQGLGKSKLVRWLCDGLPQYHIEAPINTADKDNDVRLLNKFIWEVSELDATTRKADVAALKAFVTKQTVTVRKAYGRHDTVKPALASMVGTLNEAAGFLSDETGNRRFLVTRITGINWSYTRLNVNQVWAQAVALYRAGEPWRLTPEEDAAQKATNKTHEVESVLEGWINKYFDLDGETLMSAADIVDHLAKFDIRLGGTPKAQAMELSSTLTRLGVGKARTPTWRGYRGIAPRENARMTTYDNLNDNLSAAPSASESQNDNLTTYDNLFENFLENEEQGVQVAANATLQTHLTESGEKVVIGCHSSENTASQSQNDNLHEVVIDSEVVIPEMSAINVDYVRRLYKMGSFDLIRRHCEQRHVDADAVIDALRGIAA